MTLDPELLRAAVGDANRSAQSVAREAAAHPDQLREYLETYLVPIETPRSHRYPGMADKYVAADLRESARNHLYWATLLMYRAREIDGGIIE